MSEQQKYNVVYAGAIAQGFDEEQVKRAFVFQMKIPEDKVEQLFYGNRMTLKKSLSKPKAELWKKKLLSIGAETAIVPFVSSQINKNTISSRPAVHAMPPIEIQNNHQVSNQKEYDVDLDARIRTAKAMIATQQMEQQLVKSKESNPFKKLLMFSVIMSLLVFFLYFYLDSMV